MFAPVGRCVGGERRSGVPTSTGGHFTHTAQDVGISRFGGENHLLRRWKSPPPEVASIAFVWSSAQPPPRLPLYAGQSPTPPKLRAFLRKRFTRLRRRSFKGGPVPL